MSSKTPPFTRLLRLAAPHKSGYIASVLLAILGVACAMIPYYAVSRILIALIGGDRAPATYLLWCGVAAGSYMLRIALHNASTALSHTATFAVIGEVRKRLCAKLARVPMGFVLDTPSGKLKNSIVEKADSIEPTLAHVLPEMTSNFLVPLGIVAYLFTIDWRMALCAIATLPIGLLCYMGMMRGYGDKFPQYVAAGKHMNATVVEYVNGIEVIKAFGQSATSYRKYADAVRDHTNYAMNWMRSVQIYFSLGLGIWPAVLLFVLPVGCLLLMNGMIAVPAFLTCVVLSLGIVAPLISAIYYTDDIAQIGAVMDDLGQILDAPEQARPAQRASLDGSGIRLRGVRFGYGDEEVLHGVDLDIADGSVTALVGPSGGGKSTIAKLIASMWDVAEGTIEVGGVDVKRIPHEQLMERIAYVAQDNYLFDDTVLENIRIGDPQATDEQVKAAAQAAGCHDFIMALEHGYDTVAGGAGGHLSGGERQRIAIARAMLKDADIVILDEATAYTDPESESAIQRAVSRLVAGKTLIVIAHRLSTVTDSDRIVVVRDGGIDAVGTHEELLASCPLYADMWRAHINAKDAA